MVIEALILIFCYTAVYIALQEAATPKLLCLQFEPHPIIYLLSKITTLIYLLDAQKMSIKIDNETVSFKRNCFQCYSVPRHCDALRKTTPTLSSTIGNYHMTHSRARAAYVVSSPAAKGAPDVGGWDETSYSVFTYVRTYAVA